MFREDLHLRNLRFFIEQPLGCTASPYLGSSASMYTMLGEQFQGALSGSVTAGRSSTSGIRRT